jgi:hypothetical protein
VARLTRLQVVGAALLGTAIAAPLGRSASVWSFNWTPLQLPLPAAVGVAGPREFTIERTGTYELAVQIDRPRDKERTSEAECLLGFDWLECSEVAPVINMRWTLQSLDGRPPRCASEPAGQGVVLNRGLSGSFTPGEIRRRLACFDSKQGSRYSLQVETAADTRALQPFQPRLVVQPSPALARDHYSGTAAVWLAALALAVTGVALLLVSE